MDAKKRVAKQARPLSTFEITLQVQSGITEKEASLLSQLNNIAMDNKQESLDSSLNAAETESTETEEGSYTIDEIETVIVPSLETSYQPLSNGQQSSETVESSPVEERTENASQTVEDTEIQEPLTTPLTYAEEIPDDTVPDKRKDIDQEIETRTDLQLEMQTDEQKSSTEPRCEGSMHIDYEEKRIEGDKTEKDKLIFEAADQIAQSAIQDAIQFVEESPHRDPNASADKGVAGNSGVAETNETSHDLEESKSHDEFPPAPPLEEPHSTSPEPTQHLDLSTDLPLPPPMDIDVDHADLPSPPPLEETEAGHNMPAPPPPSLTISSPDETQVPPVDLVSQDQLPSPPPPVELEQSVGDEFPLPPPQVEDDHGADEQESLPPPPDAVTDKDIDAEKKEIEQETTKVVSEKTAEAAFVETGEVNADVAEQSRPQQQSSDQVPAEPYAEAQNTAMEASTSQNGKSTVSEPQGPSEKERDTAALVPESSDKDVAPANEETQPLAPDNPAQPSRGQEALNPGKKEKTTKSCCAVM